MGELDHPESSVVNLQNVSHNVKEMHFEGDNLLGTVEVLGTPSGNILKELFKAGIKLGISSRGMGSVETVNEGDAQEVQDDFELIAFLRNSISFPFISFKLPENMNLLYNDFSNVGVTLFFHKIKLHSG